MTVTARPRRRVVPAAPSTKSETLPSTKTSRSEQAAPRPARRSRSGAEVSETELKRWHASLGSWLTTPIAYVDHPAFSRPRAEAELLRQRPASQPFDEPVTPQTGVCFLAGMVQSRLLTSEEERYFFAWMNYLRYRAEKTRQRLRENRPDFDALASLEADLRESVAVRNQIVQCNLRLVVATARKLSSSLDELSDLIGEGVAPLIRAVELFDVSLGNRFSTYATWAVRNQMLRCRKKAQRYGEVSISEQEDRLGEAVATRDDGPAFEELEPAGEQVSSLLAQLSDRERAILSARYGLAGHPSGQSLSDIASQLGLSKERVRQIALQAVEKLRLVAHMA